MHYLVLSDIHANLEALEAVLDAAGAFDAALVLGDLVGYGADPNAVIDRVRSLPVAAIVRGNHDKVAARLADADDFNQVARDAVGWTASTLTADNHAWLAALPKGPRPVDQAIEICHGTPFDEDAYVFDATDAFGALSAAARPLCLFGHTHVPAAFRLGAGNGGVRDPRLQFLGTSTDTTLELDLDPRSRYLVNCGAVGQPRDGNPDAAYGIVDGEAHHVALRRVPYDVAAAQAKIVAAGLPPVLAQRLAIGR
ncbi:MAG: hypothetical protein A3F70_03865 [Acidobacteria bacterium RIFCSPLOWO2_12_FULL_67_14]|nr:MAG: hypothetical protein A3H29_14590 [Acidobacteria bacterium RIFCSPLOWO2_02_FULL_67_21]OFW35359.1 MAG: hypothetical protein A3F70_03865 [Acidobacteria bacterium RIFCSPLOWO2_12_FULL_67_14]